MSWSKLDWKVKYTIVLVVAAAVLVGLAFLSSLT